MDNHQVQMWLNGLDQNTSKKYVTKINEMLVLKEEQGIDSFNEAIIYYIEHLYEIGLKTSTLYSILSPLKGFFLAVENKDFYQENKFFMGIMSQWQKKEETKKSAV